MIRDAERGTYEELWEHEAYNQHSPGAEAVPLFLDMAGIPASKQFPGSVLDAGCGSGLATLALKARGFNASGCDIIDVRTPEAELLPFSEVCLWQHGLSLGTYDYVFSVDVLEHVPPEFTMLAVSNLLSLAACGLFLQVAMVPDGHGMLVGRPLHLSVFPFTWWRDHLRELGHVVEGRDLIQRAAFYVEPR